MVPLPSSEPLEVNTFETIARLAFSPTHKGHLNNIHTETIYSNSTLTNNNINSSPQNNNVYPHNQSPVILQQFSMVTQKFRNFMDKVSGDVTKFM